MGLDFPVNEGPLWWRWCSHAPHVGNVSGNRGRRVRLSPLWCVLVYTHAFCFLVLWLSNFGRSCGGSTRNFGFLHGQSLNFKSFSCDLAIFGAESSWKSRNCALKHLTSMLLTNRECLGLVLSDILLFFSLILLLERNRWNLLRLCWFGANWQKFSVHRAWVARLLLCEGSL